MNPQQLWHLFETQRNKLWVLPLIIVMAFIVMAVMTLAIDEWQYETEGFQWPEWLFKGDVSAAQAIVSTVATATASIVTLVISMTMVVFSIASSQYGPMLLRNFIVDLRLQIGFGGFVGTFAYCLLTQRVMNSTADHIYVPELSVTVTMVLAVMGLFALIYVVHHVAGSLRVENLVSNVCSELKNTLSRRFPKEPMPFEYTGDEPIPEDLSSDNFSIMATRYPDREESNTHEFPWFIASETSGYVQTLSDSTLLQVAQTYNLQIRCWVRPGHFVITGQTLFSIARPKTTQGANSTPQESTDTETTHPNFRTALLNALTIGQYRTPTDDPEFAIDQLVEIALLALSPGVNRTYTAMMCVDQLTEALAWVVQHRHIPSPVLADEDGISSVWLYPVHFTDLLDAAFTKIRQNTHDNEAMTIHLLKSLDLLASQSTSSEQNQAIRRHADALLSVLDRVALADVDHQAIKSAYGDLVEALEQ